MRIVHGDRWGSPPHGLLQISARETCYTKSVNLIFTLMLVRFMHSLTHLTFMRMLWVYTLLISEGNCWDAMAGPLGFWLENFDACFCCRMRCISIPIPIGKYIHFVRVATCWVFVHKLMVYVAQSIVMFLWDGHNLITLYVDIFKVGTNLN